MKDGMQLELLIAKAFPNLMIPGFSAFENLKMGGKQWGLG